MTLGAIVATKPLLAAPADPSIKPSTQNRLIGVSYLYDAAGNMTYDGTHTYTYDGENRIIQVAGTPANQFGVSNDHGGPL
jgi:uncharacterized protein RhaS with RHS repeats